MSAFDDFQQTKRDVEKLSRETNEAIGAEKQLLKRAREEFGCKSLEHAERLLEDLGMEEREAYKLYNRKMVMFKKKFKKTLRKLRRGKDDD
jgi:predicted negative regulator of RcsB-dependent stress response